MVRTARRSRSLIGSTGCESRGATWDCMHWLFRDGTVTARFEFSKAPRSNNSAGRAHARGTTTDGSTSAVCGWSTMNSTGPRLPRVRSFICASIYGDCNIAAATSNVVRWPESASTSVAASWWLISGGRGRRNSCTPLTALLWKTFSLSYLESYHTIIQQMSRARRRAVRLITQFVRKSTESLQECAYGRETKTKINLAETCLLSWSSELVGNVRAIVIHKLQWES